MAERTPEQIADEVLKKAGIGTHRRTPRRRKTNGGNVFLHDPRPPEFSDEALALRFAEIHANDLRYVAVWNKWLRWDGARWQFDGTLFAFDRARDICRRAAAECDKASFAVALASAKTVAAVERLARSDQRLAATTDQWDADPWLLNTPAGTINLRTGALCPHQPENYITKLTGVASDPSCLTSVWMTFLARVFAGDKEL